MNERYAPKRQWPLDPEGKVINYILHPSCFGNGNGMGRKTAEIHGGNYPVSHAPESRILSDHHLVTESALPLVEPGRPQGQAVLLSPFPVRLFRIAVIIRPRWKPPDVA